MQKRNRSKFNSNKGNHNSRDNNNFKMNSSKKGKEMNNNTIIIFKILKINKGFLKTKTFTIKTDSIEKIKDFSIITILILVQDTVMNNSSIDMDLAVIDKVNMNSKIEVKDCNLMTVDSIKDIIVLLNKEITKESII